MIDERSEWVKCGACRTCAKAAYQTPPMLYAGNITAKVVIIGQNPGEIKPYDQTRQLMIEMMAGYKPAPGTLKRFYDFDFGTSYGQAQIARVFGAGWLKRVLFTNAVRCRTHNNEAPDDAMIGSCIKFTLALIDAYPRETIILLGRIPEQQLRLAGLISEQRLPIRIPVSHPKYGMLIQFLHYVTWKQQPVVEEMKEIMEDIWDRIS